MECPLWIGGCLKMDKLKKVLKVSREIMAIITLILIAKKVKGDDKGGFAI